MVEVPVAKTETEGDDMEAVVEDEEMEEENTTVLSNTTITSRKRTATRVRRTFRMTRRWIQNFSNEVHCEYMM